MRSITTGFESANVIAEVGGRYVDALPRAERALERGRRLSAHSLMHGTYTTMNVLHHLGGWDRVPALLAEHLDALSAEPGLGCPYVRGGPPLGALGARPPRNAAAARRLLDSFHAAPTAAAPGVPEAIAARAHVALGDAARGCEIAEGLIASGRQITTEQNAHEYLA